MKLVICVLLLVACRTRDQEAERAAAASRPPASEPDTPERCTPPGQRVCLGDDLVECNKDGTVGKLLQTCRDGCKAGACADTCAAQGVELVYVVDVAGNLSSFDPRKLPGDPFRVVGNLACETRSTPFSMAVDRKGVAWVLYASGNLYRVSIIDARCTRADFERPPTAPTTFGMGFVTEGPTSENENLFVAANDSTRMLARLDTSREPIKWQDVGPLTTDHSNSPELTGTSEGRLFGYFPESGRGFIQEIDGSSGKALGDRKFLDTSGQVGAFAFAHWGGVFYVFATIGGVTAVHTVDQKTGKYGVARSGIAAPIVGAGVSTCAPLLERTPP